MFTSSTAELDRSTSVSESLFTALIDILRESVLCVCERVCVYVCERMREREIERERKILACGGDGERCLDLA